MNRKNAPKLRCPVCGEYLSRVVSSRVAGPANAPVIQRRRACPCGVRYTTVERIVVTSVRQSKPLYVVYPSG